jgi:alkylhydroperoxidase family enzyme
MRLPEYALGRTRAQRTALRITRLFGAEFDDVVKVSMRRPDFFGRAFIALVRTALRGSATWSDGELELFGAVVSEVNSCPFCVGAHGEVASMELGSPFLGWRDGRFGVRATAAAEFVEAVARGSVDSGHVRRAREAGAEDRALAEAAYVTVVFNTINRVASALNFTYRSEQHRVRNARMLRRVGYRLPGMLLR